jgi:hypothetical protein
MYLKRVAKYPKKERSNSCSIAATLYTCVLEVDYSMAPRSLVLLEKLAVAQLVKKFSAFYGSRLFITVHKNTGTIPELDESNHTHSSLFPYDPI